MEAETTNERAAAEMVGALVLISILVVVIAIIAVVLFSQPAPQKLPAVAISITNHSRIIEISHESGDPVLMSELAVLIDGSPHAYTCTECGDSWSIGKTLTIDYSDHPDFPNKVDLVYKGTGTTQQLLTSKYLATLTPASTQVTPPTTATPTATPTATTTPVLPPVASFTTNVTSGTAPLAVQFTDTSTNTPASWTWAFGDGTTATLQNPVHTYTTAGTYTVTLTAQNSAGSSSATQTITVNLPPVTRKEIYLNAEKSGFLKSGGYFEFRNTGDWSYVTLGSTRYDLVRNDTVRLVLTTDSTGKIDATTMLTSFSFSNVHLYINGVDRGVGTLSGIYISSYDKVVSTLDIDVPSFNAGTRFSVDGNILIDWNPTNASRIQVYSLYPSSSTGSMHFSSYSGHIEYWGGATDYQISPPPLPPVAAFTGIPLTGMVPLTVAFTDTSTNTPISWSWNFGDSTTSTAQHPTHTYSTAGKYTVSLQATNAGGSNTSTRINYIEVQKKIFSDNFESGVISGWTKSDEVNIWSKSPKYGSYSLQLVKDGQISRTISTEGYSNITVSFAMGADSLEKKEGVSAEWYDGKSWISLGTLVDKQDNSTLYPFSKVLPATASNNPFFKLRFQINGGDKDYGYVDDIVVTGTPM